MDCIVHQKRFHDLKLSELYDILALRNHIFIVDQKSLFNDVDGLDASALHFMAFDDNDKIMAYGRLCMDEDKPILRIGRILTRADNRRQGYSRKIMESILGYIDSSFVKNFEVKLQAQEYLHGFYGEFGFKPSSRAYLEDGIMHIDMVMDENTLKSYAKSQTEKHLKTRDSL